VIPARTKVIEVCDLDRSTSVHALHTNPIKSTTNKPSKYIVQSNSADVDVEDGEKGGGSNCQFASKKWPDEPIQCRGC
jgi:hypothetical protein